MKEKKNGFTLVELLAVIVILAIILVIAVPKVMDVIKDSKKATLESTAKMIASSAEKVKVQNDLLGKTEDLDCYKVAKLNNIDYADCDIKFDGNTAKVTIEGAGKFEGLYVCGGTKTNSIATDEECGSSGNNTNTGANTIAAKVGTDGLVQTYATVNEEQVDAGIRYAGPLTGANAVKNQVYFNCAPNDGTNDYGTKDYKYADKCEIWRIIGVFNTKSSDNPNEEPVKRIKIVRNNILDTKMAWDTTADGVDYINQWGETTLSDKTTPYAGASLMQYLNGDYHNSLTSIAQGQIDNALWYTGAYETSVGKTPSAVYTAERSEAKGTGTTVVYTTTWVDKIGLIYPSDFGYAGGATCTDVTSSSCGTTNWLTLSSSNYWTISPSASYSNFAWRVTSSGYAYNDFVSDTSGVRPAIYLSSKVQIIGGDGTDGNAYILSID